MSSGKHFHNVLCLSEAKGMDIIMKHSRHLYDIYKLLPFVLQNEDFKELVHEVREVRSHSSVCPSAAAEVDIPKMIEKIIKEKVYKPDYDALTTQLLEEKVSYDTVISALK